jgi:hypothetical protein
VREREKRKQPHKATTGGEKERREKRDREQNSPCSGNTTTQKKGEERTKERQGQSERKEEVLFFAVQIDQTHILVLLFFSFFYRFLFLGVRFCVLRFFHNYFVGLFFAIRCL